MRHLLALFIPSLLAFASCSPAAAEERTEKSYHQLVQERLREGLVSIARSPSMASRKENFGQDIWKALLLFNENKSIEEAEQYILKFCGSPLTEYLGKPVPQTRTEAVFRIYLTEKTRRLLSPKVKTVIEDFAWGLLTKYHRDITRADADKPFWEFSSSENHYVNDRRRYTQAIQIVRMSERYGPSFLL
ncbi:MAG: hypothetical protein NTY19_25585, partial [Planctomycetota bacterium]|nr:hypothetical protein [Planctomycetota bacterium]